jgi:hypothetical protein
MCHLGSSMYVANMISYSLFKHRTHIVIFEFTNVTLYCITYTNMSGAGMKSHSPGSKTNSKTNNRNTEEKTSTPAHVKIKNRLSSIKTNLSSRKIIVSDKMDKEKEKNEDNTVSLRSRFLSIILNDEISEDTVAKKVKAIIVEELRKRLDWHSKAGIHATGIHAKSPRAREAMLKGNKNLKPITISKSIQKARHAVKEKNREEAESWLVGQLCKRDYTVGNTTRITGSVLHVSVALCNKNLVQTILEPFRYQRRKLCNLKDEKGQSPLFYLWDTTSCSDELRQYVNTHQRFSKNELLKTRLEITLELVRFGATLADFDFKNSNIFHRLANQQRRNDIEALFQCVSTLFVSGGVDSLRNRSVKVSKLVYSKFQKKLNSKKFIWKEFPYVAIGKVIGESFRNGKPLTIVCYYLPEKQKNNSKVVLNRHEKIISTDDVVYLNSSKVPSIVKDNLKHEKVKSTTRASDNYARVTVGTCRIYYADASVLDYAMSFPMMPIKIEYIQNAKEKTMDSQKVINVYFDSEKDENSYSNAGRRLNLPDCLNNSMDQELFQLAVNRVAAAKKNEESKFSTHALKFWGRVRKKTKSVGMSSSELKPDTGGRKLEDCIRDIINMCSLYPCNKAMILDCIKTEDDAIKCFEAMRNYYLTMKSIEIQPISSTIDYSDDFKLETLKGKNNKSVIKQKEIELQTVNSREEEIIKYAQNFWCFEKEEICGIKSFASLNKMPLWRLLDLYGLLKRFHGTATLGFSEEFSLFQKKCDFELACVCWTKYFEANSQNNASNQYDEAQTQILLSILQNDLVWSSGIDFLYHKDDGVAVEETYKYQRRSVYEQEANQNTQKMKTLKRGPHVFSNRKKQLYKVLEEKLGLASFKIIKKKINSAIVNTHLLSSKETKFECFSRYIMKLFSHGPHRFGNEREVYIALFVPGISKSNKEKFLFTDFHLCIKEFQNYDMSFVSNSFQLDTNMHTILTIRFANKSTNILSHGTPVSDISN